MKKQLQRIYQFAGLRNTDIVKGLGIDITKLKLKDLEIILDVYQQLSAENGTSVGLGAFTEILKHVYAGQGVEYQFKKKKPRIFGGIEIRF